MAKLRLLNLKSLDLECFDIDTKPSYIAVSHTWSETLFPWSASETSTSLGLSAIQKALAVLDFSKRVDHLWVDTLCIDQASQTDKFEQIPLMGRIYSESVSVAVVVKQELGFDQDEVDQVWHFFETWNSLKNEGRLSKDASDTIWNSDEGKTMISRATRMMRILGECPWNGRVWTIQEYILAPEVFWVGAELKPVIIPDLFPVVALTIADVYLGMEEVVENFRYFYRMRTIAQLRMKRLAGSKDLTAIIGLGYIADSTIPIDKIYGVMAASGVEITPTAGESMINAWTRWWEEAVRKGYLKWLMSAPGVGVIGQVPGPEGDNCAMVPLENRVNVSVDIQAQRFLTYGPICIDNGTVCLLGRKIGKCILNTSLSIAHILLSIKGYPVSQSLPLLCEGKKRVSMDLAVAISNAQSSFMPSARDVELFADVLILNHARAVELYDSGKLSDFKYKTETEAQSRILTKFRGSRDWDYLRYHYSRIIIATAGFLQTKSVTKILVFTGDRDPVGRLHLFDLGATFQEGEKLFLVAEDNGDEASLKPDINYTYHKYGIAQVANNVELLGGNEIPLEPIRIGGSYCQTCKKIRGNSEDELKI